MTTTSELKPLLKRLRLGYLLNTLPERLALARRDQLDYAAFLEIIVGHRFELGFDSHFQISLLPGQRPFQHRLFQIRLI